MKHTFNYLAVLLGAVLVVSCGPGKIAVSPNPQINTTIDLINVSEDRVAVEMAIRDAKKNTPAILDKDTLIYFIPKIVPGTYSTDNYGSFIENFRAFDKEGNELPVEHPDENSWKIIGGKKLSSIKYQVNDTYDIESDHDVFSPSGTNIATGENYILNLHGFVGYFQGQKNLPYVITVKHPKELTGVTSMPAPTGQSVIASDSTDVYRANRYAEVADNPMMYSKPDTEVFKINDIEVTLAVYSPNGVHKAADIKPEMEKMMRAQKNFLGSINSTQKYTIILYLSTLDEKDASGFGALEHNTSTVVVLPEVMDIDRLKKVMVDVVSHEFFHIVTPLSIHSQEIHNFDFNDPKMSQHLWMYEGTTEYFAQLFQIHEKLISKEEFYERLVNKVRRAATFDDAMSFTEMSANILVPPYKPNYANVYEKGTLISMCIDILIREKSNGERGILSLMKELSAKYGQDNPFDDSELIPVVTQLTYPEIGNFIETHVVGKTPIDYTIFWNKVGLEFAEKELPTFYFGSLEQPLISADEQTNEIFFLPDAVNNSFLSELKVEPNDRLVSINDKTYTLANARELFIDPSQWKGGDALTMTVKRNGEEVKLSTTITEPTVKAKVLSPKTDATEAQIALRKSWLQDN